MSMRLYIHTVGRPTAQFTWDHLPAALRRRAVLVVQAHEHKTGVYRAWRPDQLVVLPSTIRMLSPTRQWIIDHHDVRKHGPKLCLLDDDLREFDKRRMDRPDLFTKCTEAQRVDIFHQLEAALDTYAHAGVLGREGGNRKPDRYDLATRMMRVLAYHVPTVRAVKARFDRVVCKQDFDMTLQLLRAGFPNYVIGSYVQGQARGSGAVGGCTTYRTLAVMDAAAHKLARLHQPFVSVVTKTTKSAWGGGDVARTEVVVQWKKAYLSSGYTLEKPRKLIRRTP